MPQNSRIVIGIERELLFGWLFAVLLGTAVAIVLLDAFIAEFDLVPIGAVQRLFNITREDSIGNFFSAFQMLAVGFAVLLITLVVKAETRGTSSKAVVGWAVVTALFLLLGFDDGTKLHERVGTSFKELVTDSSGEPTTGFLGSLYEVFPSYTWQLVVGPIYGVAGLFLIVFLYRQLGSAQLRALAGLAIWLFVLAQTLDFLEGLENDPFERIGHLFATSHRRVVHFAKSLEEFLEMVGTTVFLYVFLKKLADLTSSLTFELKPGR